VSTGEFTLRHVHAAPPELLFDCLTTPEHLAEFWGPTGMATPLDGIVVDLRPGGTFSTLMVSEDGAHHHRMHAVYEAVDRPRLLAWRETDSGALTTITFTDLGDGTTEVTTNRTNLPDAYTSPDSLAGWATSLDRYATYIATVT
jgi:uncharacterized protein YndB with AHSA1/START domain